MKNRPLSDVAGETFVSLLAVMTLVLIVMMAF